MICWKFDHFSGFFVSSWLIPLTEGFNGCDVGGVWCLVGGRGCCFKGSHKIPSVSWIFHHSSLVHIHWSASFVTRISSLLLYVKIWVVGQGVDIMFLSIFHCFCAVLNCSFVTLVHDSCCLFLCSYFAFFVPGLFN